MRIKVLAIDKLFSKIIRLRADGKCEYCGREKGIDELECSHFIGRRNRSVRWDIDNASAVCFSCHSYLSENPYQHTEFFKKRLGDEKFEGLMIRAEFPPLKPKEVRELTEKLKEMLRIMSQEIIDEVLG